MGKLIYGTNVDVTLPDLSLFHLDLLLAMHPGAAFQLHLPLSAARDGNLLSLSVGAGVPMALEYGNSADLHVVDDVLAQLERQIAGNGFVLLPMLPVGS